MNIYATTIAVSMSWLLTVWCVYPYQEARGMQMPDRSLSLWTGEMAPIVSR